MVREQQDAAYGSRVLMVRKAFQTTAGGALPQIRPLAEATTLRRLPARGKRKNYSMLHEARCRATAHEDFQVLWMLLLLLVHAEGSAEGADEPAAPMSMLKMAHSGEDHGQPAFVRGGNDFRVAHRAARLNRRGRARFRRGDQSVGKREKRVAANDTPLEREFRFARFPNGNAARIHAAHLACADAECPIFAYIH